MCFLQALFGERYLYYSINRWFTVSVIAVCKKQGNDEKMKWLTKIKKQVDNKSASNYNKRRG